MSDSSLILSFPVQLGSIQVMGSLRALFCLATACGDSQRTVIYLFVFVASFPSSMPNCFGTKGIRISGRFLMKQSFLFLLLFPVSFPVSMPRRGLAVNQRCGHKPPFTCSFPVSSQVNLVNSFKIALERVGLQERLHILGQEPCTGCRTWWAPARVKSWLWEKAWGLSSAQQIRCQPQD